MRQDREFNPSKGVRFIKRKPSLGFRPPNLTNRRHLKMRVSAQHSNERSSKNPDLIITDKGKNV